MRVNTSEETNGGPTASTDGKINNNRNVNLNYVRNAGSSCVLPPAQSAFGNGSSGPETNFQSPHHQFFSNTPSGGVITPIVTTIHHLPESCGGSEGVSSSSTNGSTPAHGGLRTSPSTLPSKTNNNNNQTSTPVLLSSMASKIINPQHPSEAIMLNDIVRNPPNRIDRNNRPIQQPSVHQFGLPPPPPLQRYKSNFKEIPIPAHARGDSSTSSENVPVVIPISGSGTGNLCSNVPKSRGNIVTLPVPSPPALSMITCPFMLDTHSPSTSSCQPHSSEVALVIGSSSQSGMLVNGERRLISTEAQTEDFPTPAHPPPLPLRNREQRKRERRDRRREHHRHPHHRTSLRPGPSSRSSIVSGIEIVSPGSSPGRIVSEDSSSDPPRAPPINQNNLEGTEEGGLPDLVNIPPPPYSTLPPQGRVSVGVPSSSPTGNLIISPLGHSPPGPTMPQGPQPLSSPSITAAAAQAIRYHFSAPPLPPIGTRMSRRSLRTPRGIPYASEEEPKSCCGMSTSQAVSIRWFIVVIAGIGICSTVAGTALGAARSAGSQHLTLSLLMIGVGVVLLTVSAVAWRLTANESGTSSCRAMLGFGRHGTSRGDGGSEPNRVFVPRLPPSYGRPHHPYAAMMYPDFQYRPPPPSYQASMQEYRLRLLLLERSNPTMGVLGGNTAQLALTQPPPAYRPYSHALRSGGNSRMELEYSRPPSYRSRTIGGGMIVSNPDPGSIHHHRHPHHLQGLNIDHSSPVHSREASILSYLSHQTLEESGSDGNDDQSHPPAMVRVMEVSVDMGLGLHFDTQEGVDDDKDEYPPSMVEVDEKREEKKDGNLVRIVQTTDSSQVIGRDSVIVTVSGTNPESQRPHHHPHPWDHHLHSSSPPDNNHTNQVQILAHL